MRFGNSLEMNTYLTLGQMNLSETQISDLLQNPQHKRELEASELHHRRLSFHSDVILKKLHASRYVDTFFMWISELLPEDKKNRVESMMSYPLATNELTKDIFMALERVWYAKDYVEKYVFASDEYESDFTLYLKSLNTKHLWQVESWSALKTSIDSVVVVDLPEIQLTDRPEPYFYFIQPSEIIDMKVDEVNDMEYIIFKHKDSEGNIVLLVYDSISMRKYEYEDRKKGALLADVQHGLGYCPARMFWSDKLQDGNYINKRSPITDSLGDLDWLLFFKTSKKLLDMHAAYPIYITYEIEQDNESEDKPTWWEGQEKATTHKGKGLMGAGSFMTVPPPLTGQADMMANPVQVVPAEIEACQYSVEETTRLELDIYTSSVGASGELLENEAVNEKQVEAAFKSREEVLMNIARNYQQIMCWTYSTLARLRYDIFFTECLVDFGEDFYLETAEALMEAYSNAKEKGVNSLILDTMNEKINDVAFKHRKKDRERAEIYKHLDPFPELTTQEVMEMKDVLDPIDIRIKINLLKYIRMFELQFGDMIDFIPNNFEQKITNINLKIQEYAMQQKSELQPQGDRA